MMPRHHPGDEVLISYAAGSLKEPLALVVATHLSLCPRCRKDVARLEAIGGVLLENVQGVSISSNAVRRVLARLDDPAIENTEPDKIDGNANSILLPSPLRDYLDKEIDHLEWISFRGLEKVELLQEFNSFHTRLMRIKSGTTIPAHTHEGCEMTLVLAGGFSDEMGHYLRGDVAEADPSIDHRPVADPGEDCLCLAVTDAPLKLTGPFGRLLNPFLNI